MLFKLATDGEVSLSIKDIFTIFLFPFSARLSTIKRMEKLAFQPEVRKNFLPPLERKLFVDALRSSRQK
jgi:hypothetical protein